MENDPVQPLDWLIRMLVNVICRDGNILWNIAPDKNGKLSNEVHRRIREFGSWIRENGEAVYGTRGGPLEPLDDVYGTVFRGNTVFLHILDLTRFSQTILPAFPGNILRIQRMDGQDVPYSCQGDGLQINVSGLSAQPDTILRIVLDRQIKPVSSEVYFTGRQ